MITAERFDEPVGGLINCNLYSFVKNFFLN